MERAAELDATRVPVRFYVPFGQPTPLLVSPAYFHVPPVRR